MVHPNPKEEEEEEEEGLLGRRSKDEGRYREHTAGLVSTTQSCQIKSPMNRRR